MRKCRQYGIPQNSSEPGNTKKGSQSNKSQQSQQRRKIVKDVSSLLEKKKEKKNVEKYSVDFNTHCSARGKTLKGKWPILREVATKEKG